MFGVGGRGGCCKGCGLDSWTFNGNQLLGSLSKLAEMKESLVLARMKRWKNMLNMEVK